MPKPVVRFTYEEDAPRRNVEVVLSPYIVVAADGSSFSVFVRKEGDRVAQKVLTVKQGGLFREPLLKSYGIKRVKNSCKIPVKDYNEDI